MKYYLSSWKSININSETLINDSKTCKIADVFYVPPELCIETSYFTSKRLKLEKLIYFFENKICIIYDICRPQT